MSSADSRTFIMGMMRPNTAMRDTGLFFISSAHITYPAPEMNARNSSTGIPAALCGCRLPPIAKPRTASASPPTPRLSTLTEKLSACWVTALFHGPASAKMTDAISIKAMPLTLPPP